MNTKFLTYLFTVYIQQCKKKSQNTTDLVNAKGQINTWFGIVGVGDVMMAAAGAVLGLWGKLVTSRCYKLIGGR